MASRSTAHRLIRWVLWLVTFGIAALAWAGDLSFSAKVDKTSVELGQPINLTIILSGDLTGVELPPLEFPEGFSIAARSQSTNFSIRSGAMERSMSLIYVLVPQRLGTFQLGPFRLQHGQQELKTEPIDITVKKAPVPSPSQPQGERFIL